MNNTFEHVISKLKEATNFLEDKIKTPEEAKLYFRGHVSKEQVEYCLLDPNLDSDDLDAIKNILKHFFDYEVKSN